MISNSKVFEVWEYKKLDKKFVFVDNWGQGRFHLFKTAQLAASDLSLNERVK
jgi:hypothetical protein